VKKKEKWERMTRSKVALKLIEHEIARRSTYSKRKEGLRKKMEELCVLCDVKGCMLMYNAEIEGECIWPSYDEAEALLRWFESLPKSEQTKKTMNHDEYMKGRVGKLKKEVIKQELKNKKMQASILIHKITHGRGMAVIKEVQEAMLLTWFAKEKLQEIYRHRVLFPLVPPPPVPPPPASLARAATVAPPHPAIGQPNRRPESPMDPYLAAMISTYARRINPKGDGASSSGAKDT